MRRRLPLLVTALVAIWAASWYWVAGQIRGGIENWIAARQAEGLAASSGGVTIEGFPFTWRATISRPDLTGAGPTDWHWRGESVEARLAPWSWRRIELRFPGTHLVTGGHGDLREKLVLRAARPEGRVDLASDGRLDRIEIDFGDVELTRAPETAPTTATRLQATIVLHRNPAADSRTDTFDFTASLDDVTFANPPVPMLGPILARGEIDLAFKGKLISGKLADAVTAWRDSGGTVEFNRIALRWGKVDVDGNGTFALDDQNRPLAAFAARWRGYNEMVDALVNAGQLRPRDGAGVKIALNMLSRQSPGETGGTVTVPMTVQDGRLFIAGFPVARIEALRLD